MEKREVLRRVPYLSRLSDDDLDAMAARAILRRLEKNEVLFDQGEPAKGLLVVASGAIKVTKLSENGREQVLTIEGPGQSVAEVPLFDGGPYPAAGVAAEISEILFVPRNEFFGVLRRHPEIGIQVVETIGKRLRTLVTLVEELSLMEVGQRLARFLVDLAEQQQPGTEIRLDISNQEIAARIGTVRELVSRGLGRLRSAGLIAVDGREIRILDEDGLRAEAGREKAP